MNFTYFSDRQLLLLVLSSLILITSIVSFHLEKRRIALTLLFISSLGFGFFIAHLDSFLILWDEQYHALVSKHLMDNPLKPTLYSTTLLDYDYSDWTANHIWLHKQPLFLWQIALSLKIFGINELAVRIPSIILHAIATLIVYRIGKISYNEIVGFYGAVFFSIAYHLLELTAGKFATDHNDIAFMFYVTASFWAWFEYQNSKKIYWVILIGVFSGCAVLVKWLVGLLIFPVWIITLGITAKKNWINLRSYIPIIIALTITLLVFIPWQCFIFNRYPLEAKYELQLVTDHFFHPIENHSGNVWFHLNAVNDIYGYGQAVPFLLLIGIILFIKGNNAIYRAATLSAIIITYGFYSIASTKMTSFCIIVSPFGFLALGTLIYFIIDYLKSKIKFKIFGVVFSTIILSGTCFLLLDIYRIQNYHTDWKPMDNCNRKADVGQMTVIKNISEELAGDRWVVFNADVRVNGHISVMFYTEYPAYGFIPDTKQIEKIKAHYYKIAVVDNNNLPDYIRQDNEIIIIKNAQQ